MGGLLDRFKRQQQQQADPIASSGTAAFGAASSQAHGSIEPPQVSQYRFMQSYQDDFDEAQMPWPVSQHPAPQAYPDLPAITEHGPVNVVQEPGGGANQEPLKDYSNQPVYAVKPHAAPNFNPGPQVGAGDGQDVEPLITNIPYNEAVDPNGEYIPLRRLGGYEAPYPDAYSTGLYPDVRDLAPPVSGAARPSPTRNDSVVPPPPPPHPHGGGGGGGGGGALPSVMTDASCYDVNKPTCSLNIVCYRSGQEGCKLQQIRCTLRSKHPTQDAFDRALAAAPGTVSSDAAFFLEMRRLYETEMCGFFRRYFSLKTHKAFRILSYTPTSRPTVVPFDGFIIQEMMYAYRNPASISLGNSWIKWVFRLRRADRRHAVEFVEGWDSTRISVAGIFPWLSSCVVAVAWTAAGGDPQTTFTVASFILTSSSIILALLAIVSSIESSGNNVM